MLAFTDVSMALIPRSTSNRINQVCVVLLCQIIKKPVIPAGKRVSSARDGKLKSIHGAWIPAIHAGRTVLDKVII